MNKPIVTKGQEKEILEYKSKGQEQIDYLINIHPYIKRPDKAIADMSTATLAKALLIGYEVEPEFKRGDWVKNVYNDDVGIVTELGSSYLKYDDGLSDGFHNFRHATPEEIAEEKQRRFWHENGREIWEIKEEDILGYLGDPYIVESFNSENVTFEEGPLDYMEPFDFVKEHFKVICFVEDRKDLKND